MVVRHHRAPQLPRRTSQHLVGAAGRQSSLQPLALLRVRGSVKRTCRAATAAAQAATPQARHSKKCGLRQRGGGLARALARARHLVAPRETAARVATVWRVELAAAGDGGLAAAAEAAAVVAEAAEAAVGLEARRLEARMAEAAVVVAVVATTAALAMTVETVAAAVTAARNFCTAHEESSQSSDVNNN